MGSDERGARHLDQAGGMPALGDVLSRIKLPRRVRDWRQSDYFSDRPPARDDHSPADDGATEVLARSRDHGDEPAGCRELPRHSGIRADALFVCAMEIEVDGLRAALGLPDGAWHRERDDTVYRAHRLRYRMHDHDGLSIVACSQSGQGVAEAASLTTRGIYAFRPKIVIMTGICCGHRGRCDLGDIAVAKSSFDYQDIRVSADESKRYRHDTISVANDVRYAVSECASEDEHIRSVIGGWTGGGSFSPRACVGSMACSSLLVDNPKIPEELDRYHNEFVGIDKESYGVAKAAHLLDWPWLVVKGVQDYGDGKKSETENDYRAFASYASARYALSVLPRLLELLYAEQKA